MVSVAVAVVVVFAPRSGQTSGSLDVGGKCPVPNGAIVVSTSYGRGIRPVTLRRWNDTSDVLISVP